MRLRIRPGSAVGGHARVPGDKSIAHRWLILASTARGRSRLAGMPGGLDVRSTAACMAVLAPKPRPALETWLHLHRDRGADERQGRGFTWNLNAGENPPDASTLDLVLEGDGRNALVEPPKRLDCENSGTTLRLLTGLLAPAPFTSLLAGDASLNARPMERIAEPLRAMGAVIDTTDGHPPVRVDPVGELHGITWEDGTPSAQVKSAILLAGTAASGSTTVVEPVTTRDHTERALQALGGPVRIEGRSVTVEAFQHQGFSGTVPGDPSSAAFLVAAAALTGAELHIEGVGLNPTRTRFLAVMERMGIPLTTELDGEEVGEPVGAIHVGRAGALRATTVDVDELPLVIDEVPVLAAVAAHADGVTRFRGAGELKVKESDRLSAVVEGLRGLGGDAEVEDEDLAVTGGGLPGGNAGSGGDHRIGMAFVVAALAASGTSEVEGIEHTEVSFPGFAPALGALGADLEEA
ncbi:MAG: 3-phosphoshikimate 1-carboxyvinyltransferase [Actinomycetota bacterium]